METMKRMVALLAVVLVSLMIFQLAHAEIYKWVDEKGTVHFTEDPATIPEKYWDKAKSRTTEEDLMTPEEKIRAKQKYEEEIRERLKREKGEYDAKEPERRVKELVDKAQKQKGECKIISYSQYDVSLGGGDLSGDVDSGGRLTGHITGGQKNTCVDLVIQNNDREPKTITEQNIIATTSSPIATAWEHDIWGRGVWGKKKDKFNPKAVLIQIQPGETYRGSICFDRQIPIAKLELQGL